VLVDLEEDDGQKITGIPTPHKILTKITRGYQPGQLINRAPRPSHGKTAAMLHEALHAAKQDHAVGVFSLEMSAKALTRRLVAMEGRVNLKKQDGLNDDDWQRLARAGAAVSDLPIYIDDTPALTAREIATRMRRWHHVEGIEAAYVDYLNILKPPAGDMRHDLKVGEQTRHLRDTAKSLGICVQVLSQLNRSVETGTGIERPEVQHLKNSSAIEQNADIVLMQWLPEKYGYTHLPELGPQQTDRCVEGLAEIIVRKHRDGPTGSFWATFVGEHTRFEDLTTHEEPPHPAESDGAPF